MSLELALLCVADKFRYLCIRIKMKHNMYMVLVGFHSSKVILYDELMDKYIFDILAHGRKYFGTVLHHQNKIEQRTLNGCIVHFLYNASPFSLY